MCGFPCNEYINWKNNTILEGLDESPSPCIFCMRNYYENS